VIRNETNENRRIQSRVPRKGTAPWQKLVSRYDLSSDEFVNILVVSDRWISCVCSAYVKMERLATITNVPPAPFVDHDVENEK
jgi:hypothetical protein